MSAKASKSLVLKLKLPAAQLSKWPSSVEPSRRQSRSKASPASATSTPKVVEPSPSEQQSESNDTPAPSASAATDNNSLAPPAPTTKRRGIPGPKPGSKRGAALMADGTPKPRGKPGPKKKLRTGDPNGDPNAAGAAPAQKLGPRANQGAINAGLRALDRSGKPCRKWEKKGFQLKSFTGVVWTVPTWRAPPKASNVDSNGDVRSDTTTSSDAKPNNASSAVPSDKNSTPGEQGTPVPSQPSGLASSPVAVPVA